MLVDFWTYSCINCIRTLPHLRAWYAAYHRAGLEIVGVHTPEFAFEHVRGNVAQATRDLHVTWPVALDNGYKTWDAYSNEYWPAEYLVDRTGRVRRAHFGEGEYGETERAIRQLSRRAAPGRGRAARRGRHADDDRHTGNVRRLHADRLRAGIAALRSRQDGSRRTSSRRSLRATPSRSAELDGRRPARRRRPRRTAALALPRPRRLPRAGRRRHVSASASTGDQTRTVAVDGDRLYTLVSGSGLRDGLLDLRFDPGVNAYAFTFG